MCLGTSIDYAAKTWNKEEKAFQRPLIVDSLIEPKEEDLSDIWHQYYNLLVECNGLTYMGKFHQGYFDQKYFDLYKKYSVEFIEKAKELPHSPIKDWFLKQEGNLIHFDYDCFHSSPEVETYTQKIWVPSDFVRLEEDGKLLHMAESNLSSMYGFSLSPALIYAEDITDYNENEKHSKYLDEKISWDTRDLAEILEFTLKTMKKKPNDEFFEQRMPRLYVLLEALKQGAKFVYSV